MKVLDITSVKETGQQLMDIIEGEFNATQNLVIQPYPSELLMRRDQFNDLLKQAGVMIHYMTGSEQDRLYKTKGGYVMEVKVDERA